MPLIMFTWEQSPPQISFCTEKKKQIRTEAEAKHIKPTIHEETKHLHCQEDSNEWQPEYFFQKS